MLHKNNSTQKKNYKDVLHNVYICCLNKFENEFANYVINISSYTKFYHKIAKKQNRWTCVTNISKLHRFSLARLVHNYYNFFFFGKEVYIFLKKSMKIFV